MIPKKIHYCWFGKNPLPSSVQRCIDSWKKYCPDYEIIEWNEDNYDVNKIPFMKEAYKNKKYAFVSDYARLDVVYQQGGIYLDTDVELLRNLDPLLTHQCYLGCELIGEVATGLGFGAEKNHPFIRENKEWYESNQFNIKQLKTCVEITTNLLLLKNLKKENKVQNLGGITVYPPEYFCPYNIKTNKIEITIRTYSIHHYDATWYGQGMKRFFNKKLLPIKIKVRELLDNLIGPGTYKKIKEMIKW